MRWRLDDEAVHQHGTMDARRRCDAGGTSGGALGRRQTAPIRRGGNRSRLCGTALSLPPPPYPQRPSFLTPGELISPGGRESTKC